MTTTIFNLDDTAVWVPYDLGDGTYQLLPAGFMGFVPREPHGKVLFLHGWCSDGSTKSWHIKSLGYDVLTPSLSNWWFSTAVETAQAAYDKFRPDVVVGSSRGGAVAMNIDTGDTPLILLAPAWRRFGDKKTINKSNVTVIHSPNDAAIAHQDSQLLVSKFGKLISVGEDHRLNCKEGQQAMENALQEYCPAKSDFPTGISETQLAQHRAWST